MSRLHRILVAVILFVSVGLLGAPCSQGPALIYQPAARQVSEPGALRVFFLLKQPFEIGSVVVEIESDAGVEDITAQLSNIGRYFVGDVPVATLGDHQLRVTASGPPGVDEAVADFEIVALPDSDVCEVLNSSECLLPFPSSRFLEPDATKPNGVRMALPAVGLATTPPLDPPTDPAPWLELDGFSPTAPILMNFPAGVDLAASGVDRLIPPDFGAPQSRPYSGVRTQLGTSVLASSPTVLLNASTGERVMHFVELDARATDPTRQALILRPSVALEPGQRYIVAVRGLVDPAGEEIAPEPAFRVLRDALPTTIEAIGDRRWHFEHEIFATLENAALPVDREDLQLAFDYTVQSEQGLTGAVFSMQQQAYAWLENEVDVLGHQTFSVLPFGPDDTTSQEFDCDLPGASVWRILRGTYQVPLFLTQDLTAASVGVLNLDAGGDPVQNGVTNAAFTASLPCVAKSAGEAADHAVILGHGLFGDGSGMVEAFSDTFAQDASYAAAATDWRGLSSQDLFWVAFQIIGVGTNQFNNFPAFPDRLKQGQINTQLLARMVKRGDFNVDPAFQVVPGVGGMPGPADEMFYYGISLGGIMGTFFAALTPDVERFNIDVPAMNFSLLLQRSTQFSAFESLVAGVGLSEPLDLLVSQSLQHELWVRAEPAGFVQHLASGVASGDKKVLMTVAWLDKQVSNQASEILARSIGLPSLEGSVLEGLVGIPDVSGPVDSAMIVYDQGTYDIYDPAQTPFIPPLANEIPSGVCDPHSARVTIPASIDQLLTFLQPGGQIENFCTGVCDGTIPDEQPPGGPCALP